jgi:esterase/lipase
MQQNTVNEYTLIQQHSELFQENYQRNQNEQKLRMEWQHADNAWKIANSEIGQLKSIINNLQQNIDELKSTTMRMDVAEPNGPATPISSSSSNEPDYHPEDEELAKET